MGWLASLFRSSDSQNSRKGQAITSTHEAFSLPTSSPIFSAHPDSFHADTPNTPEPGSSTSYTYPPQGPNSYGYLPTSGGSKSRPGSLLPLHHDQFHTPLPSAGYPPLNVTWNRLRTWLAREYPELGDTLNYGILPEDLAQIEVQFGFPLPAVVRESYLAVDGQEPESAAGCSEGLFFGLILLPLDEVLEEWKFWREVDDDPSTGANARLRESMQSIPPNWIRKEYSQRGWIPLIADKAGNYVGVDLNPAEGGVSGQVIVFGRDFDTKVVLYNGDGSAGWAKWLAAFVDELESGEGFELGANDDSEGSEDNVGYESYYYDGTGRGQGDGDSGSGGGMRLVGEYRGWNVFEAWADRSVKKWYAAGVISDETKGEDEKGKASPRMVIDLSEESLATVPIPLVREDVPETPTGNAQKAPGKNPNLPTISITKPPAPLPVELPTPRDIVALPSPPDSTHSSFDEDLEAGRARGMRQVSRDQDASLVSRSSPTSSNPLHGSAPILPAGTLMSSPPESPSLPPATEVDLLTDDVSVTETTPIMQTPTTPLPAPVAATATVPVSEKPKDESKLLEEPDVNPDVTIRLVGGGGEAGLVDTSVPEDGVKPESGDNTDTGSISSVTSSSSAKKGGKEKKHKKSASLASLKKLGHLGRKKDSVSSIKEVTP